jgi:hypothetical protein
MDTVSKLFQQEIPAQEADDGKPLKHSDSTWIFLPLFQAWWLHCNTVVFHAAASDLYE